MAYTKIKVSEEGPVTVIAFADPATMNAAGVDTAQELTQAFDAATAPGSSTRAIVLTGEGRGFCSGSNLSGGAGSGAGGGVSGDAGSSLKTVYNPLVTKVRNLSVPLVTAVNGAAAGVGCSIDLLPRMIGRARAMEMALLGERVPAAKALEWGMINRVVPDAELMPTAMALASELAKGPASLALIRQTIWDSLDTDWADQLTLEADRQSIAGRTEDFREGVTAFLQKRPAEFKGK